MGKVTRVTAIATDDLQYALKVCQMYRLYDDAKEIEDEISRRHADEIFKELKARPVGKELPEEDLLKAARVKIANDAEEEAEEENLAEQAEKELGWYDGLYEMAYRCQSYDDAVEIGYALGEAPGYVACEIEQYLLTKLPEFFRKDIEKYKED